MSDSPTSDTEAKSRTQSSASHPDGSSKNRYLRIGSTCKCRDCEETMNWPFSMMLHEVRRHWGFWR